MSPPKSSEPQYPIHEAPPDTGLKTDIVSNIPVHQAGGAPPTPIKEGDDLDRIMEEVGTQLKKDDRRPPKRHLFSRKKPAGHHKPAPAPIPAHPASAGRAPQPAVQPQPKPKAKSSAPVLVITVTIIITGILIAAALSAYKK